MDQTSIKEYQPIYISNNRVESKIIGLLLIDKEARYEIFDSLDVNDFYDTKHQILFTCVTELTSENIYIDGNSIVNHLEWKKQIDSVGGIPYIMDLINSVVRGEEFRHYFEILKEASNLRKLSRLSHQTLIDIESRNKRVSEIVFDFQYLLNNYKCEGQKLRSLGSYSEELEYILNERQAQISEGNTIAGLSTGIDELDSKIGGIQSNCYVICARPSVGKTTLASQIAYNVAMQGKDVLFFSYETPGVQIFERLVSNLADVDLKKDMKPYTGNISNILRELENINIYIDVSYPNANQLLARCRKEKLSKNIGLVLIDHLGLVPNLIDGKQWEKIGWLTRNIKLMQLELDIPFINIMQLNRDIEKDNKGNKKRKPAMSDLRHAGSVEEDSDVIISIYRNSEDIQCLKDDERSGPIHLDIMKNRNGPAGDLRLYFDSPKYKFRQLYFGEDTKNNNKYTSTQEQDWENEPPF